MSEVFEVIFTSSDGDKASTASVWNIQTGTNLMTYKSGGICALKGQCLLGSDYVIAAEKNKPILKVWAVNGQLPLNSPRLLCPGIVTTVAVNPDSCHIAVAVQEKLHIYSVGSGKLLGTAACHFQPLRIIKWTSDGDYIACGGEDGLVTVWLLSNLVCKELETEPLYVFSDHSLPVYDVFMTPEGLRAHLISVSADKTCKIYDLRNGSLLLSLVFDTMLTAVCTNTLESDVFVGTNIGGILQFSLHSAPRTKEYHLTTKEKAPTFVGHTKSITCLSNSLDGELLLSGSADETAKIWHISSKQCLRTITHKGQVTNAFFTIAPKQMFNHDLKLSVYLSNFMKPDSEEESVINVFTNCDLKLSRKQSDYQYFEIEDCTNSGVHNTESLKNEVEKLKYVNKRLYKYAVNNILESDKRNSQNINQERDETVEKAVEESGDNLDQDNDKECAEEPVIRKKKGKKTEKKVVSVSFLDRRTKRKRKKKKIILM